MNDILNLQDLIEAMDMQSDETDTYLDKQTMRIVSVMYGEIYGTDDIENLDEFEELCYDRFIVIPSKYDINEYSIMRDFIELLPQNIQANFYNSIKGRGAFRRFKDMTIYNGVEQQWYNFKEHALRKIAARWCEKNDIKYS